MSTGYIYPEPAATLASETRNVSLSSSTIEALNSFLDELLYSVILCLPQTAGADRSKPSVRLPLTTLTVKDAVLAVFARNNGNNQSLARDAVLEAELEARAWIKQRGSKSDPAINSPNLSRRPSQSILETIHDGVASDSSQFAPPEELYQELQLAIYSLSTLGARASFHNTPSSRAAAAIALSTKKQLKHTSPLLALYASCIVNYIAAYLVKGCATIVERDASSSVADLKTLMEFIGEDSLVSEIWNGTRTKTAVEQEIATSTVSSRRHVKNQMAQMDSVRPTTAQSIATSTGAGSQNNNIGIVSTLLAPVRKASLRGKRSLPARGISSTDNAGRRPSLSTSSNSDPSLVFSLGNSATPGRAGLQVSSIPFKTPLSPAQAYQQSVKRRENSEIGENGDSGLPKDTKAFLDFADEPSNDANTAFHSTTNSSSFSSSTTATRNNRSASHSLPPTFASASEGNGQSSASVRPRTAGSEDSSEFENLLLGRETRKMSLTPSRFRNTASGAGAVESKESQSVSSPLPSAYSSGSQRIGRLHARPARPSRQDPIDEQSNEESLDDDEDLFGLAPKRKNGKKESLMDLLNSEPPWTASAAGTGRGAGLSKAERMMGLGASFATVGASRSPATVMRSVTAPSGPKKFSSIANMDMLGSSISKLQTAPSSTSFGDSLSFRPTTATTVTTIDGGFLSSKAAEKELNNFPVPSKTRLTSHKSSPNLSNSASAFAGPSDIPAVPSSSHASLSPAAMRRRLVAKDERAVRVERNDDLLDFLNNTPPPPSFTPEALVNEPTTPTFSKSRIGSSKFRNLLSSTSKKSSMVPAQAESTYPETAPSMDSAPSSTFFRMPRSRQSSRDIDVVDDFGRLPRKLSKSLKSNNTARADAEIAEMEKEIIRKQEKDEEDSLAQYKGIYAAINAASPAYSGSGYSFPAAAASTRQSPSLPRTSSLGMGQPVIAPLMTPDNSREDLYGIAHGGRAINGSQMTTNLPTPLETPPTTPHEKRAGFVPILAVHEETPAAALVRQHRRMSSVVKRKPSPRIEDEDLDALNAASIRPVAERKDSVVSILSTRTGSPRDRQASSSCSYHRSSNCEASANSFISVSSGSITPSIRPTIQETAQEAIVPEAVQKEEMEVIPTPLYTALESSRSAQTSAESSASSTGKSRPPSLMHMPISPAPKNGKPDLHDILLGLRNNMLSASSVNDCLEMLDAAMFEVAYDIKSGNSTIYEEDEKDEKEERYQSSTTHNRAYNAIIEYILQPGEMVYPKGFHRFESTLMCPSTEPPSPAMDRTPSLGYYSAAESNGSESGDMEVEKEAYIYAGHGKASRYNGDEEEVLYG